jgi:hypothetical protein
MYQKITTGTIVVGQSQSNAIQLNEGTLVGVTTGSNVTGTTMTFLVSDDGAGFFPLYDWDSAEVSITTGSFARSYTLNCAKFLPWNFVKARLGNSASAVLQATVNTFIDFNVKNL